MANKIFRNIFSAALVVIMLCSLLFTVVMYNFIGNRIKSDLSDSAQYITHSLEISDDPISFLHSLESDTRVTYIDADGTVLYDNKTDAAGMDNHNDRPEVKEAREGSVGESSRFSDTLATSTLYYAVLLKDGRVLRLSASQDTAWAMLLSLLPSIALIVLVTLLLSILLARRASQRIVRPINGIDLDNPLEGDMYDELAPLLGRISRQQIKLSERVLDYKKSRDEFNAVTGNMSEGLAVISASGTILSLNRSACRLWHLEPQAVVGKDVLALERNLELKTVTDAALSGKPAEAPFEKRGRRYTLLANPVMRDKKVTGCVVLVIDVTEKHRAEQLRREFSANVSHELKTPLQSISGYAEIIKNGLVKEKDMQRFVGNIYDEALGLIELIDDIMKLSHLDEGGENLSSEKILLAAVCGDVAARLEDKAKKQNITINVEADSSELTGVKQIIEEIVYNLCDNAIKYNRKNGAVTMTVKQEAGKVALSVSDTGIGMPEEHLTRVFERFYRIDQSRSRSVGGTGLGLSIVKHGAALHGAEVELESREGHGTTVKVIFKSDTKN